MKNIKMRQLIAGTAVTVVVAAAGVGTAIALDSDESRPEPQPPVVPGPVIESSSPNPWAAGTQAMLWFFEQHPECAPPASLDEC
jgi:hypothetical protein